MAEFDTLELISNVKEWGSLPDDDLRFTDALILSAATHQLRWQIAPLLVRTRAEHLVYSYDVPVVGGTSAYRMPPRSVGGALRDVVFLDSSGTAQPPLRELSSDEWLAYNGTPGTPYAYFTRNYTIHLVSPPNVAGTLRMPYYARPNRLVLPSAAVTVLGASAVGTAWTLTFTTTPPGTLGPGVVVVDVVRGTPGFETLAAGVDCLATEVSPGSWTFELTSSEQIVTGDYLCVAGEAPVPQAPAELHDLLAILTARRALKAVGDDRWQALTQDAEEAKSSVLAALAPRVSGKTQQAGGSIGSSGLVAGLFGSWSG